MSGSYKPVSRCVHVSPPSRLRKTPSISTPAQTREGLSGSTTTPVTKGVPIEQCPGVISPTAVPHLANDRPRPGACRQREYRDQPGRRSATRSLAEPHWRRRSEERRVGKECRS